MIRRACPAELVRRQRDDLTVRHGPRRLVGPVSPHPVCRCLKGNASSQEIAAKELAVADNDDERSLQGGQTTVKVTQPAGKCSKRLGVRPVDIVRIALTPIGIDPGPPIRRSRASTSGRTEIGELLNGPRLASRRRPFLPEGIGGLSGPQIRGYDKQIGLSLDLPCQGPRLLQAKFRQRDVAITVGWQAGIRGALPVPDKPGQRWWHSAFHSAASKKCSVQYRTTISSLNGINRSGTGLPMSSSTISFGMSIPAAVVRGKVPG